MASPPASWWLSSAFYFLTPPSPPSFSAPSTPGALPSPILFLLKQLFSTRSNFAPRGHLAMSGDIFWLSYQGRRPERLLNIPRCTGQPPTASSYPAQTISSVRRNPALKVSRKEQSMRMSCIFATEMVGRPCFEMHYFLPALITLPVVYLRARHCLKLDSKIVNDLRA